MRASYARGMRLTVLAFRCMQPGDVPAFRLRDIQLSYDKLSVLEGLDFELASGQVVGLIGANGAGKSTLIRVLLGSAGPWWRAVRPGCSASSARCSDSCWYFSQGGA